jgi:hypothetical protein
LQTGVHQILFDIWRFVFDILRANLQNPFHNDICTLSNDMLPFSKGLNTAVWTCTRFFSQKSVCCNANGCSIYETYNMVMGSMQHDGQMAKYRAQHLQPDAIAQLAAGNYQPRPI